MTITGADHIPLSGGVIPAPNHRAYYDVVPVSLPLQLLVLPQSGRGFPPAGGTASIGLFYGMLSTCSADNECCMWTVGSIGI